MRWERKNRLSTFTSNAPPGARRQKEPIMTTENIFSAVLTLSMMAGGAVAFGSDLGQTRAPATAAVTMPTVTVVGHCGATSIAAAEQVTLPTVTIVGRRTAPSTVAVAEQVTMPTVTVVGHRVAPTAVAVETESVEQRVQ